MSVSALGELGDAKAAFDTLRSSMHAGARDGIASREVPGLGDQAFLVTRIADNESTLVVRQGNAVIQTSATVDVEADRERAIAELQAQDRTITDLARALLAELR